MTTRLRGQQTALLFLQTTPFWNLEQLTSSFINLEEEDIARLLFNDEILYLPLKDGLWFPIWQFHLNGVLPQITQLLPFLTHLDPRTKTFFFIRPHPKLNGDTPLHRLLQGDFDAVFTASSYILELSP